MDSSFKKRRILEDEEESDNGGAVNDNSGFESDVGSNPDLLDGNSESDAEDGEDLDETWRDDYIPAPELDSYDPDLLGDDDIIDESYEDMVNNRLDAERDMDRRDARQRLEIDAADNAEQMEGMAGEDIEDEEMETENMIGASKAINLEAFECPLREWIATDRTRREIQRRFKEFLETFFVGIEERNRAKRLNGGARLSHIPPIYPSKLRAMCSSNGSSLEVSYGHLAESQSLLAIWLTDVPRDMLLIFDEVLRTVVLSTYQHYEKIASEVHVRIINLPISDRLRDLRQADLNNLVKVTGVVTRRTSVFPVMKAIAFDCMHCSQTLGPFKDSSGGALTGGAARPGICPSCQSPGPFKINYLKTEYGNFQKITLQESPGTVPPGRVPRYKEVVLYGDLIDIARPGEEIEVTGIYCHSQVGVSRDKNGFPIFGTQIETNSIVKKNVAANTGLSDEDKRAIRELSMDPHIKDRIIRSIAPSIYGHKHIKTAVALSLFGGCAKDGGAGGTHRVRGDINILLLGDPGTAKSQILKYAEKIAPRSIYTTGKGASAVGLTAGVHKDPMTKEWTLEGGALVLADQGVCLIDEFDKMNEQDRTSIHEAMEQQTISVSKAGIVASLQARCAVIAAANPIGGRYDPSFTLVENVELTDPILQRFDVLCVLQDIVDPVIDEKLATFVVNSHYKSHPNAHENEIDSFDMDESALSDDFTSEGDNVMMMDDMTSNNNARNNGKIGGVGMNDDDDSPQPLDQAMLKKYITYAKAFVKPILHEVDSEKVASLYAELRKQSVITGGIPIAVRHIESVMRMAEASAKMQLRDHVREDDIDMAIKVMLESFLQAQKVSVRRVLQRSFRKYITYGEETNQLLLHQLRSLVNDQEKYRAVRGLDNAGSIMVDMALFENKAKELNIFDLRTFYTSNIFRNNGFSFDTARRVIIRD